MKLLLFMVAVLLSLLLMANLQSANALEVPTAVYCANPDRKVTVSYCENHTGFFTYERCNFHCCNGNKVMETKCKLHIFGKGCYPLCSEICCVVSTTTPKPTITEDTSLPSTTTGSTETTTTVENKPTTTSTTTTTTTEATTTTTQ